MKKKLAIAGILIVVLTTFFVFSQSGYSVSGFFSKAFDKSLSPGERYEKNITVRRYYNVSIRFQKEGSTSYLGFNNDDSSILLMSENGSVIRNLTGVKNGRHYVLMENSELNSISRVSAFNIETYADVIGQAVSTSYSGTSAYVTITVVYGSSSIYGYVVDDLTGEYVDGVEVYAFLDGSNPQVEEPVVHNVSSSGKYLLSFDVNSSTAIDVYVKDYDVD